jgi:hypothetical protein
MNCNNFYHWNKLGETCKKVHHKLSICFHFMKIALCLLDQNNICTKYSRGKREIKNEKLFYLYLKNKIKILAR